MDAVSTKENRIIGGRELAVTVAPRTFICRHEASYIGKIFFGLLSLFKGLFVTLKYFLRPSSIVTQQYPENRKELKMFDRYRAQLRLIYNDEGTHPCTGCGICDTVCPNESIRIITRTGPVTGKKELDRFVWRFDTCTFCNLCVQACPFVAIDMTGNFESSVYDRRLLIYNLNNYSGPYTKMLEKIEDPEQRKKSMSPNEIFSGKIPLAGTGMHGINALPAGARES